MKKCYNIHATLFLAIINFFAARAQNIDELLRFADAAMESGNYGLALKEYQRASFFNKDSNNAYIFRQIAAIYQLQGKYNEAAQFYDHAYFAFTNDSTRNEMIFCKVNCYLFSAQYHFALAELYSLGDSLNQYFRKKKYFYEGVVNWALENFGASEKCFVLCLDPADSLLAKEIHAIFANRKNIYLPNPSTAKVLSIIFPGMGQWYAGDVKNGFNSLLLTSGLLVIAMNISLNYTFFDALITIAPWFQRYYQGGYQKAGEIAAKKREQRRVKAYKQIIKTVERSSVYQ